MDSFPPTPTPTPEPLPVHRHFLNKKFAITLVAILVFSGIAYAGLWYWQNQNSKAVVPSAVPVDTSTWKTYTNTQYGFSFRYPNYFSAKEFSDIIDIYQSNRGVELNGSDSNLNALSIGLSIDDTIYVGGAPEQITSSGSMQFGVNVWKKRKGYSYQILPGRNWFIDYSIIKNGHSFDFSFNGGDDEDGTHPISAETEALLDQIVSTFKFTNSVDTSTWKTYTNSQFGFQMGYPSANSNDVVQGGSDSVLYDGLSVIEGPTIDVGPYTIVPSNSDKQKGEMTTWMNRYLNQADTKATGLSSNDRLVCQRLSVSNPLVTAVHCSDSIDQTTFALIKNGSVWVFLQSSKNNNSLVPTSEQELKTLSTFKFTNSVDTSTWKTYTVKNAFSFKYPNTLVAYDPGVSTSLYISSTFIKLGSSEIRIQVLNPNQSYLPKNNPSFDVTTYPGAKEMSVDGVDAWQYEPAGNGYFLETDIYKMPNVIEVSYVGDAPPSKANLAIYNQILSTVKFLK